MISFKELPFFNQGSAFHSKMSSFVTDGHISKVEHLLPGTQVRLKLPSRSKSVQTEASGESCTPTPHPAVPIHKTSGHRSSSQGKKLTLTTIYRRASLLGLYSFVEELIGSSIVARSFVEMMFVFVSQV